MGSVLRCRLSPPFPHDRARQKPALSLPLKAGFFLRYFKSRRAAAAHVGGARPPPVSTTAKCAGPTSPAGWGTGEKALQHLG
jgi:hypothetical protein